MPDGCEVGAWRAEARSHMTSRLYHTSERDGRRCQGEDEQHHSAIPSRQLPKMPPISKTRRLPFKPPSRISAAGEASSAGPSTTKNLKRATTGNATSSGSQPQRRNVRPAPVPESVALDSESETEPASPDEPASGSPAAERVPSVSASLSPEPDYILAEITTTGNNDEDIMTSEPKIPSKLMTALLHRHFQDDKTRVTKDAAKLYAKYIDIFVREAVARAVYEKKEKLEIETLGSSRIQTTADNFLEVCI